MKTTDPHRIDEDDARGRGRPRAGHPRAGATAILARCALVSLVAALGGCGTTASGGGGVVDSTLSLFGLQRPQPQMPTTDGLTQQLPSGVGANGLPLPRKITFRLHAGDVLNTDPSGRSLSIVARVYKLKDRTAFEAAPYAQFQDLKPSPAPEFMNDVVDVKEIVMTPGKQYDVIETVGPDAPYFAVVGLFRAPAPQRWRFVFDTKAAASSGVSMGIHACALSVSAGEPLDMPPEMARVAGVRCPES